PHGSKAHGTLPAHRANLRSFRTTARALTQDLCPILPAVHRPAERGAPRQVRLPRTLPHLSHIAAPLPESSLLSPQPPREMSPAWMPSARKALPAAPAQWCRRWLLSVRRRAHARAAARLACADAARRFAPAESADLRGCARCATRSSP